MTRRRRGPLWVRVLVAFAGGALLAVVLLVSWLAYELNGGLPLPHTDPHDPRVDAAHARWAPAWEERHAAMVAELEAAGLVLLSVNEVDTCHEGETSWKRRDPYGLQCRLTWEAFLGAPGGDPTSTVTTVHEMAEARSEPTAGPSGGDTLLSNLGYVEEDSTQVSSASYDGVIEVGEDRETARLEAFLTREPRQYLNDEPIFTYGDVVRSTGGPGVEELEDVQQEWVGPTGRPEDARWLVRLTDRVDYFAR